MANYRVLIKPSAVRELEAIGTKKDRQRVAARVAALAADPRPPGVQKLSGRERYRIRQGRYRIVYSIEDERPAVTVVRIGHRRDVYRGVP